MSIPTTTRVAGVLAALALPASRGAAAQSPLSREFERAFFARREGWVDRLFSAAPAERRRQAVRLLAAALTRRGWADSLAGERCRLLSRAAAVLAGRDPDRFFARFNWYLLALPEVVDPEKTGRDRVKLGELTRRIYPLLKPVKVADPDAIVADADKVFLTARGVFGFEKPERLRLRFRVAGAGGEAARTSERGDSERDPKGWLMFDLFTSFRVADRAPGPAVGSAEIGIDGRWPQAGEPPLAARFWVRPGYFAKVWDLLAQRERLDARTGDDAPRRRDLARLDVLADEALRVLLGKDYLLRSWPVEALDEGLVLARSLAANKRPTLPERGDRVWGIDVTGTAGARVLPARITWGPPGKKRRAWIVFPPGGLDENWVADGLGIAAAELQQPGNVFAFTTFPLDDGYLEGLQDLLRTEYGVRPEDTGVVGLLDGGTRARYALGLLAAPPCDLVLIGREVPDVFLFDNRSAARCRVIPAYGRPTRARIAEVRDLLAAYDGVRFDPVGPRSQAEAFRVFLRSLAH